MRLTPQQAAIIRDAAREVFSADARAWLFGSCVDDRKRGGDIDLLLQTVTLPPEDVFLRKVRFIGKLHDALGEQKIDVVIEQPGDARGIVRIAHQTGVAL